MATQIEDVPIRRVKVSKRMRMREALGQVEQVKAERCRRSFYHFMHEFWECVSVDPPHWNWHMEYMCQQAEKLAYRVAARLPRQYDLIVNVPPGSTKSITWSVMFPVWCWIKWPWMSFITASYASTLALEQAEKSRDLVRHEKFRSIFSELTIKQDKDTKGNFRVVYINAGGLPALGGSRFSTSVGGTLTGFHGHIIIIDDPIDPKRAVSVTMCKAANDWMDQTASTRKVDKEITPTVLIMQRLHQNDPTGHMIEQSKGKGIFHICLPGELDNYKDMVRPVELLLKYKDNLLDPVRLSRGIALSDALTRLGQYGYAGQIGQNPVPPAGGMFKIDRFNIITQMPNVREIISTWRYWDKAATKERGMKIAVVGARTAGVKMSLLKNGKFLISDCKAGRWDTDEREDIIKDTAAGDGSQVNVGVEQEPGSGGKDSALATIRSLAGFHVKADRPIGDKVYRADPYSVQVNYGNVMLLRGDWNHDFIEEHRFFPFGTTKDKVDAASGAFKMLTGKRKARMITKRKTKKGETIQ